MSGSNVPRSTRWSWHALVASLGEEGAFEALQHMPGLGEYTDEAYVKPPKPLDWPNRRVRRRMPGDWMPQVHDLDHRGKRVWTGPYVPPTQQITPLKPRRDGGFLPSRKERNDG